MVETSVEKGKSMFRFGVRSVLNLYARGLLPDEIAKVLGKEPKIIEADTNTIIRKFKAPNIAQAVFAGVRAGEVDTSIATAGLRPDMVSKLKGGQYEVLYDFTRGLTHEDSNSQALKIFEAAKKLHAESPIQAGVLFMSVNTNEDMGDSDPSKKRTVKEKLYHIAKKGGIIQVITRIFEGQENIQAADFTPHSDQEVRDRLYLSNCIYVSNYREDSIETPIVYKPIRREDGFIYGEISIAPSVIQASTQNDGSVVFVVDEKIKGNNRSLLEKSLKLLQAEKAKS